jgi:hypothetical protein
MRASPSTCIVLTIDWQVRGLCRCLLTGWLASLDLRQPYKKVLWLELNSANLTLPPIICLWCSRYHPSPVYALGQTIILPLGCFCDFLFVTCTRETKQFEQLDVECSALIICHSDHMTHADWRRWKWNNRQQRVSRWQLVDKRILGSSEKNTYTRAFPVRFLCNLYLIWISSWLRITSDKVLGSLSEQNCDDNDFVLLVGENDCWLLRRPLPQSVNSLVFSLACAL